MKNNEIYIIQQNHTNKDITEFELNLSLAVSILLSKNLSYPTKQENKSEFKPTEISNPSNSTNPNRMNTYKQPKRRLRRRPENTQIFENQPNATDNPFMDELFENIDALQNQNNSQFQPPTDDVNEIETFDTTEDIGNIQETEPLELEETEDLIRELEDIYSIKESTIKSEGMIPKFLSSVSTVIKEKMKRDLKNNRVNYFASYR